jgi:inosine/xanthosine triphosphatase
MHIFIGSTNPIKINAVITAASETWPDVIVQGFSTHSGISEQPLSDEETRQGARNRAVSALHSGLEKTTVDTMTALGVGLEGGVFIDKDNIMWSTVWIAVTDVTGEFWESNGARFKVPEIVANQIRSGGEMGPVVEKITGRTDIRRDKGMISIITDDFIDRTEEYTGIVKMALGLWYGRNWQDQLNQA